MVKMDRVDIRPAVGFPNQFFGKITNENDDGVIEMDVKYPEQFKGSMMFMGDSIKAVTHGVYVPTQYRTSNKKSMTTKRSICKCKK